VNVLDRSLSIDRSQLSPLPIVVEQRAGLLRVDFKPVLDRLESIIWALPVEQTSDKCIFIHIQFQHRVNSIAVCREYFIECFCLGERAWESIQQAAICLRRSAYCLSHHIHHQLVGYQFTLVYKVLSVPPQFGFLLNRRTKHISRGEVCD